MTHRRSGAQRRAAQKAALRLAEAQQPADQPQQVDQESTSCRNPLAEAVSVCTAPRKGPSMKPTFGEIFAAIRSLYVDEMKPYGRLLRKRIAERSVADPSDKLPDVDVHHLRTICNQSEEFVVTVEDSGDWSVILANTDSMFVDVYSIEDIYPAELWAGIASYFESASDDDMTLPGGRYSCAQALQSRCLSFLEGCSLGQLCHIVQLAISEKKLLGYLNGAIVTYGRSQSMLKETCAVQQQALANPCNEAASLPCATWEQARVTLRSILEEAASAQKGPAQVALSNIKRTFRSQFGLELSETMLGHSKLSELLQDARFGDICYVQLEKHGYTVVQHPSTIKEHGIVTFCVDEPLCLADAEEGDEIPAFGPTPGPFGPTPLVATCGFGGVELLRLGEDAHTAPESNLTFGPTPGPFSQTAAEGVSCDEMPTFGPTPGLFGPTPHLQSVSGKLAGQEDQTFLKQLLYDYIGQSHSPHEVPASLRVFCADEPLNRDDEAKSSPKPFCAGEPLCLDAADHPSADVFEFGPSPGGYAWSYTPHCARPRPALDDPQPPGVATQQVNGGVEPALAPRKKAMRTKLVNLSGQKAPLLLCHHLN